MTVMFFISTAMRPGNMDGGRTGADHQHVTVVDHFQGSARDTLALLDEQAMTLGDRWLA